MVNSNPDIKVTPSVSTRRIVVGGPTRFGGTLQEEFLTELRFPQAVKVYNEMRKNSPVIGGFLRAIEASFRSTRWQAFPYDDSDEAKIRAAFLEHNLQDMDRPWPDVLTDILTFLPFGFAALEMVFKQRRGRPNSKFTDGLIGLRDLVLIPHDTILEWVYDMEDPMKLNGIVQLPASMTMGTMILGPIFVPMSKTMLCRLRAEKNSPEGESILRQAYRPYYFMTNLETVEAISLERTGAGIPMMKIPAGSTTVAEEGTSSDEAKALDAVKRIRVDEAGGLVIPDNWTFELVTSKGLRPELFDLAIKRHRANILISVLAVFLELGTARVGSFATAKTGRSYFENAMEGIVMSMEDCFNSTVVPLLFELNGIKDNRLPKLGHHVLAGESLEETVVAITKLSELGMFNSEDSGMKDYLWDLLRLPKGATVVEREGEKLGELSRNGT